jgi:hypothetical protein
MRTERVWQEVPMQPVEKEKVLEFNPLFGDSREVRREMCECCEEFGGYINEEKKIGFRCWYGSDGDHPWADSKAIPEACEAWEKKEKR